MTGTVAASMPSTAIPARRFHETCRQIARPLAAAAGRLAAAQQDLARKTARALVRNHDLIAHEKLQVTNMTARPRLHPDGDGGHQPNGAAAKAGLNKSILDAGWGIFLRSLLPRLKAPGGK